MKLYCRDNQRRLRQAESVFGPEYLENQTGVIRDLKAAGVLTQGPVLGVIDGKPPIGNILPRLA